MPDGRSDTSWLNVNGTEACLPPAIDIFQGITSIPAALVRLMNDSIVNSSASLKKTLVSFRELLKKYYFRFGSRRDGISSF